MLIAARLTLIAALVGAAGCPSDDTPPPDGGGGEVGLSLTWTSSPATIPGATASGSTIERAAFGLHELRVIGDAGTLEVEREGLAWASGVAPVTDLLGAAPPGVYARMRFELEGEGGDDGEYAYELVGTTTVGGVTRPFAIRDGSELAVTLELAVALAPGGSAAIPVQVELGSIVDAVDFSQVPLEDGLYLVREGPQLAAARAAVTAAFAASSPVR